MKIKHVDKTQMTKYLLRSAKYTHADFIIKLTLQNHDNIPRDDNGETKDQSKSKAICKEALLTAGLCMKLFQF